MAGWLKKKWLNFGPGSPGKTAKVMADNYLSIKDQGDVSKEDIFTIIVGRRVMSWYAGNIMPDGFTEERIPILVEQSDEDLPSLTYFLMYIESPTFRKNVVAHSNTFKAVTEVIHEEISKKAPDAVNKTLAEFRETTLQFSKVNR